MGDGTVSEWIKHDGKSCPVSDDAIVYVKFRDGSSPNGIYRATYWEWDWNRPKDDRIIAYRVVKP